MRAIFLLSIIMLAQTAFGQSKMSDLPKSFATLGVGKSFHGSGDMRGVSQRIMYGQYFNTRLFWFAAVGADLHDGEYGMTVTEMDGRVKDRSLRYTTGAMQAMGGAGISFLRTRKTELGIRIGALLRYQSSSQPDGLNIVYDPERFGPYPAMFFDNVSRQRTFAVGAAPEVFFQQTIFKSFTAGISAGIQFDTNGDVLRSLSLSIGKRFR